MSYTLTLPALTALDYLTKTHFMNRSSVVRYAFNSAPEPTAEFALMVAEHTAHNRAKHSYSALFCMNAKLPREEAARLRTYVGALTGHLKALQREGLLPTGTRPVMFQNNLLEFLLAQMIDVRTTSTEIAHDLNMLSFELAA